MEYNWSHREPVVSSKRWWKNKFMLPVSLWLIADGHVSKYTIRVDFINAGTHHLYLARIKVSLRLDTKECVCLLSLPTPLNLNYKHNWV